MLSFNYRNTQQPVRPTYNTPQYGGYATKVEKPVAPATYQFYATLCNEKGEELKLTLGNMQSEVQAEIERLRKLPNFRPISEAQINKITTRCDELGMATPNFERMSITIASDLIAKLDTMYKERGLDQIITKKQVEMIQKMAMCPDIPVFSIFLPQEMLEKADQMQFEYNNKLHALNAKLITEEELNAFEAEMRIFEGECQAISEEADLTKVDRNNASEFIQAYQQVYYSWYNSRASEGKRKLLGELFKRQGTEMTEAQLFQYDNHTADLMINQLQKEMGMKFDGTLEGLAKEIEKMPKSPIDVQKYDHEKLQALIHSLYAILGQQAEEETLQAPSMDKLAELCEIIKMGFASEDDLREMLSSAFNEEEVEQIVTNTIE